MLLFCFRAILESAAGDQAKFDWVLLHMLFAICSAGFRDGQEKVA